LKPIYKIRRAKIIKPADQLFRLKQQIDFISEIDQLKEIIRQNSLCSGNRLENTAEHSWHLALMAVTLVEYANESIDLARTIQMLLVHDLVEIDAGDTYCHDAFANQDKAEREAKAADRIFGLLPAEQGQDYYTLWKEFEDRETPEAQFANALDRFLPLLQHTIAGGSRWQEHKISKEQVMIRCRPIEDGSALLWQQAELMIQQAVKNGRLLT